MAELLDDVGEDRLAFDDGLVDVGVRDLQGEAGHFVRRVGVEVSAEAV